MNSDITNQDTLDEFKPIPQSERIYNLSTLEQMFQNQKTIIINTELFNLQIFDQLKYYCQNNTMPDVVEFQETKQFIDSFYNTAQRIVLQLEKCELKKIQKKALKQFKQEEEQQEDEICRETIYEIKQKLIVLDVRQQPLPFLLSFLKVKKIKNEIKLTINNQEQLLDLLNWQLAEIFCKEQDWINILPKDIKMKELLQKHLQLLYLQRESVQNELAEIIIKTKKTFITLIGKTNQIQDSCTRKTCQSIENIIKDYEFLGIKDITLVDTQSLRRSNGIYFLMKLLLAQCHARQIAVPEVLLYTKISGQLSKIKNSPDHSNVIRIKKKICFFKKTIKYKLKEWCERNQIVAIEFSSLIPQYVLRKYDTHLHEKFNTIFQNQHQDYFLVSQFQMMITNYQLFKQEIRMYFKDLRFLQNKFEIYDLYFEFVENYDHDLHNLMNTQHPRFSKDIIIACMIKHLDDLVESDNIQKNPSELINFLIPKEDDFQFLFQTSLTDGRTFYVQNKSQYLKVFVLDMISIEQPFTYLMDFLYCENGKIQQILKQETLGQFFYCQQIRNHFLTRYDYMIELEERKPKIIFTYIPSLHQDYVIQSQSIDWDTIVIENLKLIDQYSKYILPDIERMIQSQNYQKMKKQMKIDGKYFQAQIVLMEKIEKSLQKPNNIEKIN